MNDLNHLENHLRSWKLRRPSPNLKARIFAQAAQETVEEPEGFLPPWRWWAPVTALLVATLTLVSGQFSRLTFTESAQANIIATAALNHPSFVAYLPAAGHSEANAWPGTSFEWTNHGRLVSYTNGLMSE